MIKEKPIVGKIYKVKLISGRTWLFMSDYQGYYITAHRGAYCINCGGDAHFEDLVSNNIDCHVGGNRDIISLSPANENEIVLFKRKLGIL